MCKTCGERGGRERKGEKMNENHCQALEMQNPYLCH